MKYLDAKGLKVQIMITIRKLLGSMAQTQPLLLIIDDCHWIDNESLELLELMLSQPLEDNGKATETQPLPIMFLGLSRIEKERPFYQTKERLRKRLSGCYDEIILRPLEEKVSNELIFNLLNVPGFTAGFKDKIISRAEGNPFYLEEIIRSLIDSGVLYYESGVWNLAASFISSSEGKNTLSKIDIPTTVHAVIASRLDKLEPDVRDVLQMASVIGRNFYAVILERLCRIDSLMLTLHLATLEDYDYIREQKQRPESEYAFRHTLFQEVAYNSLLKSRRKELHSKVGELVEHLYRDRLDEFTELLAYQYANSDNSEKAVEWLMKAGQKAKDRYANAEAVKYYERVISALTGQVKGKEAVLMRAYEAQGDIYRLTGEHVKAVEVYQKIHEYTKDPLFAGRSKRKTGDSLRLLSRYNDALTVLNEAEGILTSATREMSIELGHVHSVRSWSI